MAQFWQGLVALKEGIWYYLEKFAATQKRRFENSSAFYTKDVDNMKKVY